MVQSPSLSAFGHFLQPYIFILKEGQTIQQNYLDYSLLLLQMGQGDILPSPHRAKKTSNPTVQLLKR